MFCSINLQRPFSAMCACRERRGIELATRPTHNNPLHLAFFFEIRFFLHQSSGDSFCRKLHQFCHQRRGSVVVSIRVEKTNRSALLQQDFKMNKSCKKKVPLLHTSPAYRLNATTRFAFRSQELRQRKKCEESRKTKKSIDSATFKHDGRVSAARVHGGAAAFRGVPARSLLWPIRCDLRTSPCHRSCRSRR